MPGILEYRNIEIRHFTFKIYEEKKKLKYIRRKFRKSFTKSFGKLLLDSFQMSFRKSFRKLFGKSLRKSCKYLAFGL